MPLFSALGTDWIRRQERPVWAAGASRGLFLVFEGTDGQSPKCRTKCSAGFESERMPKARSGPERQVHAEQEDRFLLGEGLACVSLGTGRNTARILARCCEAQAGPVKWMCFPNRKTPIGNAIDLYLRRPPNPRPPPPQRARGGSYRAAQTGAFRDSAGSWSCRMRPCTASSASRRQQFACWPCCWAFLLLVHAVDCGVPGQSLGDGPGHR